MKTITVSDENGKKYTLEYSKASIMHMEKQGFSLEDFERKPVLMTTMLVQGAFIKNHSSMKYEKAEAIFKSLKNKEEFVKKLLDMYSEQSEEIVDEGNSEWEANF